jgi:hypothetical protein
MKIVLGGSRHLEFIPDEIAERLLEWMESSSVFLVGDAPGTDRAFQMFLSSQKYPFVTVYTSADEIRNNLGNWQVEKVESGLKSKSNAVHAFKDRKMSQIADIGLMIWDCKSAGTLSNVIDLLGQCKNCFIWVAPDSDLYQFDNSASLEKWMENYPEVRDEALKRLSRFHKREAKRVSLDSQPDLFG